MIILRKYPEEQKEFSILSEISRLGLKKGTKNYIRKRKRDIVNKLIQNKREFLAKTKKTERKLTNLRKETKENELIADNLKKEANKVNADIIPNNKFSKLIYQPKGDKSYILNKEKKNLLEEMSNDKSLDKASRELAKSSSTKDAIINLNADAIEKDTPFAAHELGHVKNSKKSINSAIQKLADKSNNGKGILADIGKRTIGIQEENNAWKNGIKDLKKAGATKEEIKHAKNLENAAIDTYRKGNSLRNNLNEKLLNKLHPKEIDNYKVFPGSHKEEKDLMELFGDKGRTERQKYNLRRKIINKKKPK